MPLFRGEIRCGVSLHLKAQQELELRLSELKTLRSSPFFFVFPLSPCHRLRHVEVTFMDRFSKTHSLAFSRRPHFLQYTGHSSP